VFVVKLPPCESVFGASYTHGEVDMLRVVVAHFSSYSDKSNNIIGCRIPLQLIEYGLGKAAAGYGHLFL
jgi:hypothetical protein